MEGVRFAKMESGCMEGARLVRVESGWRVQGWSGWSQGGGCKVGIGVRKKVKESTVKGHLMLEESRVWPGTFTVVAGGPLNTPYPTPFCTHFPPSLPAVPIAFTPAFLTLSGAGKTTPQSHQRKP
ncbi:hypothetical protein Pmani_034967 [Petrolisthes manimaculis]|uniref:Uncharacterized protein n=1 Tax=Petrolisthes manimaculis TaxID=1843537 RepID=A0AAE1TR12_9EUCA|nr:hypothetical protein Pmani_034967 [Petrolisthes manimaculis]